MLTKDRTPMSPAAFVSVMGWIFLILSGFGLVFGLVQNLLLHVVFDPDALMQGMRRTPEGLPPLVEAILRFMPVMAGSVLSYSVVLLVSSVGLLKRLRWARWSFIGTLIIGAIIVIVSPFVGSYLASRPGAFGNMPDPMAFKLVLTYATIINLMIALAIAAVFGGIVRKLLSVDVAAVFRR